MKEHGTNNWINFANLIELEGGQINVVRIKSASQRELITKITTDRVYAMHSFAQTERYCILFAHPAYVDKFTILKTGEPGSSMKWDGEASTYVHVVNLLTGEDNYHKRTS